MYDLFNITTDKLEKFHEKVLYLIENIGIQVKNEKILKRLADFDGVKIKKSNVMFSPDIVNKFIFNIKFDLPPYFNKDNFLIISGGNIIRIKDKDTGKIRFATIKDLVETTKLEDSLNIAGGAAVRPLDIPNYLQEINMYKILWENSRFKGNDLFDINSKSTISCCKYIYEMAQVLNKRFTVGLWIRSPRILDEKELDIVYYYLNKNVGLWVGNFPIYGVSSPIFIESGLAQAAAELFSGYLMLRLLKGDNNVYIQIVDAIMGHPFDWKYGTLVYSSVEDILKTIYQVSINNYYNIPNVGMSLVTTAKLTDCQAGFEKGIHTIIAAMLGVKVYRVAGILALDNYYSFEQLLIDYEMVKIIEKIIKRRNFDTGKILVDKIMEVKPGGNFFCSEDTILNFKKEYHDPILFCHSSFDHWQKRGSMSIEEKANELVKEKIKNHYYEISKDKKREINKIYKKAIEDKNLEESYKNI